jgi:siderophore synthetase component
MSTALSTSSLHERVLDGDAQRHAIESLLNCYLREYALPRGEANLDCQDLDLPMSLRQQGARRIGIRLAQGGRLILLAERTSVLGRCRFISAPYLKRPGQGWHPLHLAELARLLLAPLNGPERHGELLQQIDNSLRITRTFLRHAHAANQQPPGSQQQADGHARADSNERTDSLLAS